MPKPYAISSTPASHTCILISKPTIFAGISLGDATSLVVAYSDDFFYILLQDHTAICICLGRWRLAASVTSWLYRIFLSDNIPIDLSLIMEIVGASRLQKDPGDGGVTLECDLHTHTQWDTQIHNYTHTNVYTPSQTLQHPRFSEYVTMLNNHR